MSKQLYYNTVKLYINYSKSIMNMLPNYIQASIYSNRELTFIINKNYNKLVLNFLKNTQMVNIKQCLICVQLIILTKHIVLK